MAAPRAAWLHDAAGRLRPRRRPRRRGDDDARPLPLTAVVTIFRAEGCHLCESAQAVLERVRADVPFELEEVDITGDAELERRYRERIPVVSIDGEEAFTYFVHADALRRRLLHKVANS